MECITQGFLAYMSTLSTIFILYPYRDYVKIFSIGHWNRINAAEFCAARYKGMLQNFHQPMILAVPFGLLYTGFLGFHGGVSGVLLGGSLFGVSKTAVNCVSRRLAVGTGNYAPRQRPFTSMTDMLRYTSTQFGFLSFFCGAAAASLIAVLWHGMALASLQRYDSSHSTWGQSFLAAFRTHASLTLLTNPLRNTLRSGMYQRDRPGGVRSFSSFLSCERQVFQEGVNVFRAALRTEGLPFFLNGALRTTFKTSIPFAASYTVFKSFGGSLGGSSSHMRNHSHHNRMRSFRHF